MERAQRERLLAVADELAREFGQLAPSEHPRIGAELVALMLALHRLRARLAETTPR